jgi:hypothetical protein
VGSENERYTVESRVISVKIDNFLSKRELPEVFRDQAATQPYARTTVHANDDRWRRRGW